MVGNIRAGVVEVGSVVAAVVVHVVDVALVVDVGVKDLEVAEGLGEGVEGVEYGKGDSRGEVTDSTPVKIDVVNIRGRDAASGVDNGVVAFGECEVELEDVDGRWAEVAEAAILNDLVPFVEGRWWGGAAASSAAVWTMSTSGRVAGGGVVVGIFACRGGIGVSLWGGGCGRRELGWGDVDCVVEVIGDEGGNRVGVEEGSGSVGDEYRGEE